MINTFTYNAIKRATKRGDKVTVFNSEINRFVSDYYMNVMWRVTSANTEIPDYYIVCQWKPYGDNVCADGRKYNEFNKAYIHFLLNRKKSPSFKSSCTMSGSRSYDSSIRLFLEAQFTKQHILHAKAVVNRIYGYYE